MDLGSRNVGHEPRDEIVAQTQASCSMFRAAGLPGLALLAFSLAGCQSLSVPIAQWSAAFDSRLARKITRQERTDSSSAEVEQSHNLLSRWLSPRGMTPRKEQEEDAGKLSSRSSSTLVLGSDGWRPMMKPRSDPEADRQLEEAMALFKQGKLAEAESAFQKIARNRKGNHWGEKAQFHLAECQYQQRKYVKAHDSFERLFADYPGTEFLDKLVSREYALAQLWLGQSDPAAKPEQKLAWYSHFNGEQPFLDTAGMGLKALEHVRQHDPEGALADDAVLQVADYHMRVGDYESAAIYYDQLITMHAKSPFLQKAQLAAIDARLKGYLGPEYDGSGLEQARELVKQTMASFPDRQASVDGLYHTLDIINDQDAERTYKVGEYYKRIGKATSAEYYFGKIPQRWPNSPWAVKAKTELAHLAKLPRKASVPSKIMGQPGATDPYYSAGAGGMSAMGGMGMMPGGMN